MANFQPIFLLPIYMGCCRQKFLSGFFRSKNILGSASTMSRAFHKVVACQYDPYFLAWGCTKIFLQKFEKLLTWGPLSNFAQLYLLCECLIFVDDHFLKKIRVKCLFAWKGLAKSLFLDLTGQMIFRVRIFSHPKSKTGQGLVRPFQKLEAKTFCCRFRK